MSHAGIGAVGIFSCAGKSLKCCGLFKWGHEFEIRKTPMMLGEHGNTSSNIKCNTGLAQCIQIIQLIRSFVFQICL